MYIVGPFADNLVAENLVVDKVFKRLHLLAMTSRETAAAETIKMDCFRCKIYYLTIVNLVAMAVIVIDLRWQLTMYAAQTILAFSLQAFE